MEPAKQVYHATSMHEWGLSPRHSANVEPQTMRHVALVPVDLLLASQNYI